MKRTTIKGVNLRFGELDAVKLGAPLFTLSDPYYLVLTIRWRMFFLLVVAFYVLVNLLFAGLYMLGGECIANARPGVFTDVLFFSIETFATVGYGAMSPQTLYGHIVSSIEIVFGMLSMAVITGLMFTRYSRPQARLLFSKVAVVAPFGGRKALMLRVANQRHHVIADAKAKITLLRTLKFADGRVMRRFVDLGLERAEAPMLALSWSLIHPIDEHSPLFGLSAHDLHDQQCTLIVSISGYDESISSSVTSRSIYPMDAIRFDHDFVDILHTLEDGRLALDLTRFHDVQPLAAETTLETA